MSNSTIKGIDDYDTRMKRERAEGKIKPIGGHGTGRCMKCGSSDLWDDNTAYGCNSCKAIYFTGELHIG